MSNIQIYSWVINCSTALSYSYFMGRKDNNLISFLLCLCEWDCVSVFEMGLVFQISGVSVCLYCFQSEYAV